MNKGRTMKATGTSFKIERPHREGAKAAKKIFEPFVMFRNWPNAIPGVLRAVAVQMFSFRFVRFCTREKSGLAVVLLSLLLMGMDNAVPEAEERRQLAEKQAQLEARIASLKREQDFLLFQKAFFGSDSKYLVIDLAAGTGTLKYRNRTLRTFGITVPLSLRHRLREGRYLLTAKNDGTAGKRSLVFQDSFAIHGKGYSGASAGEKRLPGMTIGSKDLAALYFAVDNGTMIYVR